jgi:GTP-binding protein HflX
MTPTNRLIPVTHAAVIYPWLRRGRPERERSPEEKLAEAVGLAGAIGLSIEHAEVVACNEYRPATLIGRGKVDELAKLVSEQELALVIFDAPLSPIQQRNLERALNCKVLDRTGLILEIFGERARTREGTLQVELAHLTYQRSRLVRSWTHLERQRGGFGFLGGPGESQIEIDRRLIDERIIRLKNDLQGVARTRELHRRNRHRNDVPVVALVGYTNAGKSTLFNRLTTAEVLAKDMLFATLDPTMRSLVLPSGRKVVLSDTVGFIADLPTQLVAAFRATLEEVLAADLIVHVRDVAHSESAAQAADVAAVLAELGVDDERSSGILTVLNKVDLLPAERAEQVRAEATRDGDMVVSALDGEGCPELVREINRRLSAGRDAVRIDLDSGDGAALAWLYRHGRVTERRDEGSFAHLMVELEPAACDRFRRNYPNAEIHTPA